MQPNINNIQYHQQMQLLQQQRLARMMQQNQPNYQQWDNGVNFNRQYLMNNQQKDIMRPQVMSQQPVTLPQRLPFQQPPQIPLSQQQLKPQPQLQTQPIIPPVVPIDNNRRPPLTEAKSIIAKTIVQKKNLEQYIHRDEMYQNALNVQHKRHVETAQSKKQLIESASLERKARMQQGPTVIFGPGYRGCGNEETGTITKLRFPGDRRKYRVGKREPFRFSHNDIYEQASKEEVLVPIRIELEHEGYKLRDTFTWNLNESLITPEQFAEIMCEDLRLPVNIFSEQIAKVIKEQIEDYNLNASNILKDEFEEAMENKINNDDKQIELRTVIKLDITVGNWQLIDQFEWDISYPRNSPEEFAEKLVIDLGLGSEFKTAIAHSIREQIHVYIKSLLLVGYKFNKSSVIDDELKHSFLPQLKSIYRDYSSIEKFTPSMIELSDAVIDKMDKDLMRESRRKRRGTRARRGIVLPDREPQKTHRTGFAIPPDHQLTDEQFIMNSTGENIQLHSSKRSAALKARMNIAAEAAHIEDDFEEKPKHNIPQTMLFNFNPPSSSMNAYISSASMLRK
ncbi:uncharacterized protein BX663DRAFT_499650 [Cokeromyces recurvatus]|uniref:uncharacterized protein n=1 Tax=Cokeromyces recurvatus TaxID=90255 RepID=UPI0022204DC9|nr:uncharacterized protein BX663DRAFT_499650 [Cokeromyces recurvatus]KAI7905416.1 hypothetical protein BX663DRAFT_499650 [Cokeromyces recurvatus]